MNLGLRGKLFLLSGILIFVCILTGVLGYFFNSRVVKSYDSIASVNLPNLKSILIAQSEARSARMYLYMLSTPNISKDMRERAFKRFEENFAEYDKELKQYASMPFGPGEEEIWKDLEPKAQKMRDLSFKALELAKKVENDANEELNRKIMIDFMIKELNPAATDYIKGINAIVEYQANWAKENLAKAQKDEKDSKVIMVILILGMTFAGFLFAFFMARDLTDKFKKISNSLNAAGNEVSQASTQVATASQQLSQAVHEQAASIQETAASLEELTSTIAKNSDTSKDAEKISSKSKDSATHGREVVGEMMKSMDEINVSNQKIAEQVEKSNKEIAEIVKVITEIGNKTKVINDIVFQTKLLSFNASVEAARAGENGKGFAVVAEEVGNLAQMSGKAANEISSMLDESIHKVSSIVKDSQEQVTKLITDGSVKLTKGNEIAKECGEVFNEIFDEISHINTMSNEISMASEEQTKGVQEINSAVSNLDLATQQNASVSQQSAAAAEQLSRQAESLKAMVSELLGVVDGNAKNNFQSNISTHIKKAEPSKTKVEMSHARATKEAPVTKKVEPKKPLTEFKKPTVKLVEKTEEKKIEIKKDTFKNNSKKGELTIPSSDDERFEDVV